MVNSNGSEMKKMMMITNLMITPFSPLILNLFTETNEICWQKTHYLSTVESSNKTSARKILKTFNINRRKVFPYAMVYNCPGIKGMINTL